MLRATTTRSCSATRSDQRRGGKLLRIGVTPVDAQVDPVRLAALTNVTAVVMNSPDAYSIR